MKRYPSPKLAVQCIFSNLKTALIKIGLKKSKTRKTANILETIGNIAIFSKFQSGELPKDFLLGIISQKVFKIERYL